MADLAYREVYLMNQIEARKHLIQTFQETGSLSETARRWHTSRQVVRKWLRRFQQGGEKGLQNKSRRPHHSPRQTPSQVEQLVLKARQATHYGRERLALYLQRCGISISPWLRTHGITTQVTFQTDWGDEFGGDNPSQIAALETRFLRPLQGALRRYPKGRKQYNGRVERSHRADDEEFYRPYLLQVNTEEDFIALSARWVYFYNVLRPHLGTGMEKRTPLQVLRSLGYNGVDQIALFPPLLLDRISTDLLLACDPEGGNDLLAYYTRCNDVLGK